MPPASEPRPMPSPFRRLIPALLHCLLAAPVLLAALPAAAN